jgi:hypothetical protein
VRFVVVLLFLSGEALAGPTWADWVGDWQGKLRWTGCASDSTTEASLPLEATDGAVAIDLSSAGGGLATFSLVEDNAGWLAKDGDATVHVSRPRADALELAIDLDSGCQVRGTLHRASIGIAACDRLAAWARVEARCTKLVKPPRENAARLARQRESWAKVAAPERAKIGAQCEARATRVETELVDAGCAPDATLGMHGAECRALAQSASRLSRCPSVPSDLAKIIEDEASALVGAAQHARDAELPYVEGQCRRVRDQITQTVQQSGCPLM